MMRPILLVMAMLLPVGTSAAPRPYKLPLYEDVRDNLGSLVV